MSVGVADDEAGESTNSGIRSVWASPRICNGVTNAINDRGPRGVVCPPFALNQYPRLTTVLRPKCIYNDDSTAAIERNIRVQ